MINNLDLQAESVCFEETINISSPEESMDIEKESTGSVQSPVGKRHG
ncbi:MAG: hypothetical protein H7122_07930 [Chitinophagaceae bacterium]|nr:hypothetical protein [Chitinophagaceae bacterium]